MRRLCFTTSPCNSFLPSSSRIKTLRCSPIPAESFPCHRPAQRIRLSASSIPSGETKSPDVASPGLDKTLSILTYETQPIEGQKTGTSGLRARTATVISAPNFLPNFVQSLFTALGSAVQGTTLVVGGDGRFYNSAAVQTIVRIAAANGFAKVVVGRDGIMSTPAVAALIPRIEAHGGIVLTASHNPGGPDGDWGIKYNTQSGAPALEALTGLIYAETCRISKYYIADLGVDIDLSTVGITSFSDGAFEVQVVDPVDTYLEMLKELFDFTALRTLIAREDFSLLFDAMHAVTGQYARRLFVDELGAADSSVLRGTTLPDFGGGHPDPNLTYAAELVSKMQPDDAPAFGAASDGDGDRNMILGNGGIFVNPADSVAIIAANARESIPYFRKKGLVGLARSMPTASSLDRVAKELDIPMYETPTGWKFFSNLMDAGLLSICGEESFGTGSTHVREKDGLWAVLCWLSILATKNRDTPIGELFTVKDILLEHWRIYGRTYALRHDYENVPSDVGNSIMENLRALIPRSDLWPEDVELMDEFRYVDSVDASVAEKQGVRMYLKDEKGRIVVRLSGTGSSGATVRVYFEGYQPAGMFSEEEADILEPSAVLSELVERANAICRITELTGRSSPTVST